MPDIPGICGIVKGAILPEFYGIEAGQSAVGDIFKWWVEVVCQGDGATHRKLGAEVAGQKPGQSGLLAAAPAYAQAPAAPTQTPAAPAAPAPVVAVEPAPMPQPVGQLDLFAWRPKPREPQQFGLFDTPDAEDWPGS